MRGSFGTGIAILGIALFSGLLVGCASPATPAGMVPTGFDVVTRHAASVSVGVTGGRSTGDLDAPQISNEALAEALTAAIKSSGVFSSVADDTHADYRLEIRIFRVQSPIIGFTMRANMEVGWTLLQTSTNTVLWKESIASDYTATTSDAISGAARSRMAVEGAAREIIKKGIAALSRLPLDRPKRRSPFAGIARRGSKASPHIDVKWLRRV